FGLPWSRTGVRAVLRGIAGGRGGGLAPVLRDLRRDRLPFRDQLVAALGRVRGLWSLARIGTLQVRPVRLLAHLARLPAEPLAGWGDGAVPAVLLHAGGLIRAKGRAYALLGDRLGRGVASLARLPRRLPALGGDRHRITAAKRRRKAHA